MAFGDVWGGASLAQGGRDGIPSSQGGVFFSKNERSNAASVQTEHSQPTPRGFDIVMTSYLTFAESC